MTENIILGSEEEVKTKRCIACQEVKLLVHFNKYARSSDGHFYYCKECSRRKRREWYRNDPDYREKVSISSIARHNRLGQNLRYRLSLLVKSTRSRANKYHLKFDLDVLYLQCLFDAQNGLCALTKRKMTLGVVDRKKASRDAMSVDRIKPDKGYVKGNVRLVTNQANVAKYRYDDNDLLEFCYTIIEEFEKDKEKWGKVVVDNIESRIDKVLALEMQAKEKENETLLAVLELI